MLVVSAYTPAYAESAARLVKSCERFRLSHRIVPIAGDWRLHGWPAWMRNCHQCFRVVLEALEDQHEPVLWVDADATFERLPIRLLGLNSRPIDLAFAYMPWGQLADGTFWVKNSTKAKTFLSCLIAICDLALNEWLRSKPQPQHRPPVDVWEQKILQDRLEDLCAATGAVHGTLRPEECFIHDCERQITQLEGRKPVVVHWQASRGLPGGSVAPLPVLFPDALEVVKWLENPVTIYGNAPQEAAPVKTPSVVWFNNGRRQSAPKAVRVVNCHTDVPVPDKDCGVTATVFTPGHTVHDVHGWGVALERSCKRALAVPREDWATDCRLWAARYGVRNPSTGLIVLHRLAQEGVQCAIEGFTGLPGSDHSDERSALRALGFSC